MRSDGGRDSRFSGWGVPALCWRDLCARRVRRWWCSPEKRAPPGSGSDSPLGGRAVRNLPGSRGDTNRDSLPGGAQSMYACAYCRKGPGVGAVGLQIDPRPLRSGRFVGSAPYRPLWGGQATQEQVGTFVAIHGHHGHQRAVSWPPTGSFSWPPTWADDDQKEEVSSGDR